MDLRTVALMAFMMIQCVLGKTGMDEFMSCDRLYKNKRTARLLDSIPCDMTKQSYCNHKGVAYPETAIWQFKEENKALMRRLYGDMESTSVYREMRATSSSLSSRRTDGRRRSGPILVPNQRQPLDDVFPTLQQYNIRMGSGSAMIEGDGERPIIKIKRRILKKRRPAGKKSSTTLKTSISTTVSVSESPAPTTMTLTTIDGTTTTMTTSTNMEAIVPTTVMPEQSITTMPVGKEETTTLTSEGQATTSREADLPTMYSDIFLVDGEEMPQSRLGDGINVSDPLSQQNEEPADPGLDDSDKLDDTLSELLANVSLDGLEEIMEEFLPEAANSLVSQLNGQKEPSASNDDDRYLEFELIEEDDEENEVATEHGKDEAEDSGEVDYTGDSVNACPVKEEVWAPYWANNTKGQTLALMNIYPFEQYVHMEVCKFDKKQMLCRRGCRCEQQYGLHRLLAFDPNNECRGIFSDWFKFPSLCICKCYNAPDNWYETIQEPQPKESTSQRQRAQKKIRFPYLDGAEVNVRSIPAFLPYEAKHALLQEIRTRGRRMLQTKEAVTDENTYSKSTNNQHFLYRQAPITEYKLADGSSGIVNKVPRK